MRIVTVIQARTRSTRLSGKVLLPLAGRPLLERMVQRVRSATTPFDIVVATTKSGDDDAIVRLCDEIGVSTFRGDEYDLLDRHYRAAVEHAADAVAKIPSDCPLIDPATIDLVIGSWLENAERFDFVSNLHPATWPDGQDVEIMPLEVLETAWHEAALPMEREHTTPFIWERPDRFRCGNVVWPTGRDYSMSHRWTIDYPEDYRMIAAVYDELFPLYGHAFGIEDILELLDRRPDIATINEHLAGVNWYRNHLHELTTIDAAMTRTPGVEGGGILE